MPGREGKCGIWKAHALLPGFDLDVRLAPTIVMRQARGVLQRRGDRIYIDASGLSGPPVPRRGCVCIGGDLPAVNINRNI